MNLCVFHKDIRNFRKDISNFLKDIRNFRKDIRNFLKDIRDFRKDIRNFRWLSAGQHSDSVCLTEAKGLKKIVWTFFSSCLMSPLSCHEATDGSVKAEVGGSHRRRGHRVDIVGGQRTQLTYRPSVQLHFLP